MAEQAIFAERELAFLRALQKNKVRFLLVGLAAATLQGAPVVTQDIDLWFGKLSDPGIKAALKKVGGIYVPSLGHHPPMFAGEAVKLFDIVTTMSGLPDFDVEWKNAVEIALEDLVVKVLPLERILVSKTAANREKDRLVIPVLKSTLAVIKSKNLHR